MFRITSIGFFHCEPHIHFTFQKYPSESPENTTEKDKRPKKIQFLVFRKFSWMQTIPQKRPPDLCAELPVIEYILLHTKLKNIVQRTLLFLIGSWSTH